MFDTFTFLKDHFRTPPELVAMFRSYGLEPPRDGTVSQWFNRKTVPSNWFPILLAVLELHHGAPVSVVNYMRT